MKKHSVNLLLLNVQSNFLHIYDFPIIQGIKQDAYQIELVIDKTSTEDAKNREALEKAIKDIKFLYNLQDFKNFKNVFFKDGDEHIQNNSTKKDLEKYYKNCTIIKGKSKFEIDLFNTDKTILKKDSNVKINSGDYVDVLGTITVTEFMSSKYLSFYPSAIRFRSKGNRGGLSIQEKLDYFDDIEESPFSNDKIV